MIKGVNMKKIKSSLTLRIFWITVLLLTTACFLTYVFIALAMPVSYSGQYTQEKEQAFYNLGYELEHIPLEEWGPLVDQFILEHEVNVVLMDPQGQQAEIPGQTLSMVAAGNRWVIVAAVKNSSLVEDAVLSRAEGELTEGGVVIQTDDISNWSVSVASSVVDQEEMGTWEYICSRFWGFGGGLKIDASKFSRAIGSMWDMSVLPEGETEYYQLIASVTYLPVNQAVDAMGRILPWLAVGILCMSIAGALIYSRYITRPIVALNGVSRKMAALDFSWKCDEKRQDEIGELAQSFNELSGRLSAALEQLQSANQALQEDIDRERELEQQRMIFFSAVSHELKTPITIIKGQLEGMIGNVGAYRDRDKYLARSLDTACRMEEMVQEILTISRMESETAVRREEISLDRLVEERVRSFDDLAEQKGIVIQTNLEKEVGVYGDASLLKRVTDNLLSNALSYSPRGERVFVAVRFRDGLPVLMVENTGVTIPEECLPHLFEAFYRVEKSRNRRTGGSGLGLYLVKMILERHGAFCTVENTAGGVLAVAAFGEPLERRPKGALEVPRSKFMEIPSNSIK